ncbi:o-succinylbenzoate synthase [Psychromonas marina]|uniref:o-succinylbenzoate synthase n=1 Tax=Psychromonas marina TaxID=88364 RepID=A0ABQ6DZS8_9GAMM|nr:o-succinylbenzoate synthase [Psychromonas marina]GLS90671.1 o-succinylbenzoate synthase [Psychromonas marina]
MCNKHNSQLITEVTLYAYTLPFHKPMQFKQYQLQSRDGLILQLSMHNGINHFVEIAPLPGFSHERLADVKKQVMTLLASSLDKLLTYKSNYASVQFAFSALTIDNSDQAIKIAMDNIPLLQGTQSQVKQQYQRLDHPVLIKLKVARTSITEDIATFQSLCELNPALKIRCDANQAWNKQQAIQFFSRINVQQLDYIEEPTNNHQLNLQLAEQYQVPLGLDETLQQPNFDYQHNQYVRAFIIKPTIIGDRQKIDKLVSIAMQQDINISFSSSFESVVGLQQLKTLANHYANIYPNNHNSTISLGIDTLKFYDSALLVNEKQIAEDCQKLEVLWTSNEK